MQTGFWESESWLRKVWLTKAIAYGVRKIKFYTFFYQAALYLILICFAMGVFVYRWGREKSRKYSLFLGTDTHTGFKTSCWISLIFSSFLVIMKLEVVGLVPHQDIFEGIPVTRSLIFPFNFYHGKFQTYSELKE